MTLKQFIKKLQEVDKIWFLDVLGQIRTTNYSAFNLMEPCRSACPITALINASECYDKRAARKLGMSLALRDIIVEAADNDGNLTEYSRENITQLRQQLLKACNLV